MAPNVSRSSAGFTKAIDRRHWALLALAHSPDGALTPVQIQKTMFLLGESYRPLVASDFYNFRPYNYGPFDADVYRDLDQLVADGLAIKQHRSGATREYMITESGTRKAQELKRRVPAAVTEYLSATASWARRLTFSQLVRAVYARFPTYRANSVFQG
jgi:uncharacterized protein